MRQNPAVCTAKNSGFHARNRWVPTWKPMVYSVPLDSHECCAGMRHGLCCGLCTSRWRASSIKEYTDPTPSPSPTRAGNCCGLCTCILARELRAPSVHAYWRGIDARGGGTSVSFYGESVTLPPYLPPCNTLVYWRLECR